MPMNELPHRPSDDVIAAKQRFGIVGNAPGLIAAVERSLRVAPIDLSVLITGESGSGKEFFPKIIHAYSPRKHAKYIAVNCGAIPEGTIDSELFGHEKGAFTGAVASRKGYFEEADGGTIFLDEVAELPLTTQARLLRVLESGEFLKVGSSEVQKTNIRVVAATNVDLIKAVEEGRFREDLYYRLSSVQIQIPPLRDRGADIGLLTRKFAADFAERWRVPPIAVDDVARAAMSRYSWPGNVRQLKNVVDQMALFEAGTTVDADTLRRYLPQVSATTAPAVRPSHTYEAEREMLMSLIMQMQARIDRLEAREHDSDSAAPARPRSSVPAPIVPTPALHVDDRGAEYDGFVTYSEEPDPDDRSAETYGSTVSDGSVSPKSIRDAERDMIREALARHGGHRKAAAEELKISQRTLYRKIKEYDLE